MMPVIFDAKYGKFRLLSGNVLFTSRHYAVLPHKKKIPDHVCRNRQLDFMIL
jgi:hypothetical protein